MSDQTRAIAKSVYGKLGPLSARSIGMVGSGIFAMAGLTIQLTTGAAPVDENFLVDAYRNV
jgi:hypothetical protein